MKRKEIFFCFLTILLLLSSCASRKNFVYLNDMQPSKQYVYDAKYEAVVHKNDRLSITVTCKRPELAVPFNVYGNSVQVGTDGNVNTSSSKSSNEKGYRVDVDGNIDFPILGKLHVEGLKVSEVTNLIKNKIIEGNYIKDPQVSLEFLNFKYTVLGAVGHNGTFTVDDDRITILEAIANAGDLTDKAKINMVTVIREANGTRQMYVHDLRSTELFTSPCYYLQQNDIVYVEPKYRKKDKEDRGFQFATMLISVGTLVTSILWLTKD